MAAGNDVQCMFSQAQGSLHVLLRPGLWIPGVRTPHMYKETWRIEGSPDSAFKDLLSAIDEVSGRCRLQVRRVDDENLFISVTSFTKKCSWVDVLEFQFDTALIQSGQ